MEKDKREWETVTIQKGESLHEALRKKKCAPDLPCGGRGVCGLCSVEVEKFGSVKSCQFRLAGTYRVRLPERAAFEVVQSSYTSQQPAAAQAYGDALCIAIDIGTTTVAWKCGYQNREVSGGFVNPQRQFGADVMSRIRSASDGHLDEMKQLIAEALQSHIVPELMRLLDEPAEESGGKPDIRAVIAANTTMLHILNGWDCAALGKAPFAPHSVTLQHWKKQQDGQRGTLSVTELPGISAFVGADIVSGLYALDVQRNTAPMLFLDLGTNGEMAIGAEGNFLVTSTAAGPAFEASEQALSLHASGLLAVMHRMLKEQVMDENGTLCDAWFDTGYPVKKAVITQDLIRELQMAKAAIRAGIEILIAEYGIPIDHIETVYLAGGMGYYIEPEDAIAVGLIPEELRGRIHAVGNTSLAGAVRFLQEPETAPKELAKITEHTREIVLAEHPDFEELYIRHMSFDTRA
jgi:uncharacterized 2Fe-2S/4Fe-4S cluster protein (DUF4445 family)